MEDLNDSGFPDDDIEEVIELNEANFENDDDDDDDGVEGAGGEPITDDVDDDEQMEAVVDDADLIFSKHKGSVFCCDLEPSLGQFAVSGSEDERAFVWSTTSGDILFECKDHKDSVTCVSFSHDGTLVATGDMSGLIQVWQMSTNSKIWSFETSDLTWLQWHPSSHVLLAGTMDGDHWMWRIPGADCKMFTGHGVSTGCCKILADGKRAGVGYNDGSVCIWDLKSAVMLQNIAGEFAHNGEVTCIDSYHDNVLVLTGSIDGTAKLINSTNGKVLAILNCALQDNTVPEITVETVGFCSNFPFCATGTLKGQLTIWDIPTQVQRQVCQHEAGIVKLVWDRVSPLVYTAGLDGALRLWDARSGKLASQWTGHEGEILDAVLSRDGNTILTASDDDTCRIYHVNKPDR